MERPTHADIMSCIRNLSLGCCASPLSCSLHTMWPRYPRKQKNHLRQIIALNSIHHRNHTSIVCLRVKSDRLASPRQKLRKPRSPSKSPTFTFIKLSQPTNLVKGLSLSPWLCLWHKGNTIICWKCSFSVREDHSWKTGTLPVKGKGQRKHFCLFEQIGVATCEANWIHF